MNIPLPRELEELFKRKVENGEYESASDLVVEALYVLAARDRFIVGEQAEHAARSSSASSSASTAKWLRPTRCSRGSVSGCARAKHR